MKHLPFESDYRSDFYVLEERQGNSRLFPHTAQLPAILRAVHLEFYGGLPQRISRVDKRASDFDKIVLKHASLLYCNWINAARTDDLRLYSMLDENRVCRPTLVQQITTDDRRGKFHRFQFYGGKDFVREIYLCGRRVLFSDHVLQRFSSRTENHVGEDLSNFLITFFNSPMIAMPVGNGRAFVIEHLGSILAFTYKEVGDDYFITTCLTMNEIHSLMPEVPPHAINIHYNRPFIRPTIRNWLPVNYVLKFCECWQRKVLPAKIKHKPVREEKLNWHEIAHFSRDQVKKQGHGPGSKLVFVDDMPGTLAIDCCPGQTTNQFDELVGCKQGCPGYDWDAITCEREKAGTYAPARWG